MKYIIITIYILTSITANAQDSTNTLRPKIESVMNELIEVNYETLNTIRKIDFSKRIVNNDKKILTASAYVSTHSLYCWIMQDEVPGLLDAVTSIKKNIITNSRKQKTNVHYTTKNYFEIGADYNVRKDSWALYIELENTSYDNRILIDENDLKELEQMLIAFLK
jgi:hypothetical protein